MTFVLDVVRAGGTPNGKLNGRELSALSESGSLCLDLNQDLVCLNKRLCVHDFRVEWCSSSISRGAGDSVCRISPALV